MERAFLAYKVWHMEGSKSFRALSKPGSRSCIIDFEHVPLRNTRQACIESSVIEDLGFQTQVIEYSNTVV